MVFSSSSPNSIMSSTDANTDFLAWLSVPAPLSSHFSDSVFNFCRSIDKRELSSVSNQLRLPCFKLCRILSTLMLTWLPKGTLRCPSRNTIPLGKVTYSFSLTLLYRKVVKWWYFMVIPTNPLRSARTMCTAAMLNNGAEGLSKLISGRCQKPCSINLAL